MSKKDQTARLSRDEAVGQRQPKPPFKEQHQKSAGLESKLDPQTLAHLIEGIRVNAVAPGPVWTPLNPSDAGLAPKDVAKFGGKSPLGRPAQPEELAPAYVFLASNADSSYITGTVLQVMGGETTGG